MVIQSSKSYCEPAKPTYAKRSARGGNDFASKDFDDSFRASIADGQRPNHDFVDA